LFHEVYISYGTNPYLISYYPASLSFSSLLKRAQNPPYNYIQFQKNVYNYIIIIIISY